MKPVTQKLLAWLVILGWVYFTYLFVWFGLYLLSGDRWWYMLLLNSLAHHAFWPLPLIAVLATITRRRSLWAGIGAAVMVWAILFGGLFNFRQPTAQASSPTFRAMTYNVESRNRDVEAVAATIRAADADVIGLHELAPTLALALGSELREEYPYRMFNSDTGIYGMGILSRYPIEPVETEEALYGLWIGDPQAVRIELPEGPVMVLHVHFTQGRNRDVNASQVTAWAASQAEPVVVVGDLNATDLSDTHGILTDGGLQDAWREVGWGYGSTFPMVDNIVPYLSGPMFSPKKLIRIDYVFHTDDLRAIDVERLPWDGQSDHLAVVAEFSRAND
jgi:endonuclease/exonuclease/phosphatase (EEP) superfamily protein YafD